VTDVLGQELLLPRQQDAAYGAALITAVAAGLLDISPASIREVIQLETRLQPNPDQHAIYSDLFEIYQAAERSLADVAHRLSAFEQNGGR
jgi:sugar (pentulose or hexulose) kinase